MKIHRSSIAGGTDYTGADLKEIIAHLIEWKDSTQKTLKKLNSYREQVESNIKRLDNPDEILEYIDFFEDRFKRYTYDLDRLISELPVSGEQRHVRIIENLHRNSKYYDKICRSFKNEHIVKDLIDEDMRPLLDEIYSETAGQLVDYWDLMNLNSALRTFVGSKSGDEESAIDKANRALELKPNIYGIGINLNYIIKKFLRFFRKNNGNV